MSNRFFYFKEAAIGLLTRRAPLPLAIDQRLVVDMGQQEQNETGTTLSAEFQSLAFLLQRFETRFRIRLIINSVVNGSPLVNPFASSIVVADKVKDRRSIREDKIASGDVETGILYGLAALFENVRGHAAPRDDINYSEEGINRIGKSFMALQDDGQIVSSVGPNSLMELRHSIKEVWAVDPAFWSVLHGTDQNIKDAYETQYTARYHSPQILRSLLEAQLEWLLDHPRELRQLGDAEKRTEIQRRILEEKFFPKLKALYEKHRPLMERLQPLYQRQPPQITDVTADKDRDIPALPEDIIAHNDNYRILGLYVPKNRLEDIAPLGGSAYVALESRHYERIDGKNATESHLRITPSTCLARITDSVFSGHYGELVLARCVHKDAGASDGGDKIKMNLFVQMKSASDDTHGFSPLGAAGALFEAFGGYVDIGHKIYAVVDRELVDPLADSIKTSLNDDKLAATVTPHWVIMHLVDKGLVSYIDASALRKVFADQDRLEGLKDELYAKAREAKSATVNPAKPGQRQLRLVRE